MEQERNRFTDIYDQYDDDIDDQLDTNIDFDNLYLDFNQDDNGIFPYWILIPEDIDDDNNEEHELHESQQQARKQSAETNTNSLIRNNPFSTDDKSNIIQMSTVPTIAAAAPAAAAEKRSSESTKLAKKTKMTIPTDTVNYAEEHMSAYHPPLHVPEYLSDMNPAFDTLLNSILDKINHNNKNNNVEQIHNKNALTKDELKLMALLFHHYKETYLQVRLWATYLLSGIGRLTHATVTSTTSALQLWPNEVRMRMIEEKETSMNDPSQIDHQSCHKYARKIVRNYREQANIYETQWNNKRSYFRSVWTCDIDDMLSEFVQHYGITLLQVTIDAKIIRTKHQFIDN
ncbi:unnamed protein product, partial [Adineta ricciae]